MRFDLTYLQPIVELGYFAKSVGGDQPDFSSAGIGGVNESEVRVNISGGQNSDALLVCGYSFLQSSLKPITNHSQIAGKSSIHHLFQLGREFFALRRAFGIAHLQILRRD